MTYEIQENKMAASKTQNGIYFYKEINQVLSSCKDIDEFEIIPSIKPEKKSCSFIHDETKLGIFSWCVQDLFCYAYTELKAARKCVTIENEGEYVMDLSRVVLLLHSEDYTVWNLRKCYVARQTKIYGKAELDFCALVLRKHPRSAETFSHRRWLISLLQETEKKMFETRQFLQKELVLTLVCAERYRDNYIAWNQRCWLVDYFMVDKVKMIEDELMTIKDWLWTHVSDNCVYHFRQHLLKKVSSHCSSTKIKELLLEELKLTDEMLKHYPVFETIWCHRRFLISFWSTKIGTCYMCLLQWQNKHRHCQGQIDKSDLKEIKEKNCACCKDKSEIVSFQSEIELCQQIIDYPEQTRQADLAKSQLTWLNLYCKKLLESTSKEHQEIRN